MLPIKSNYNHKPMSFKERFYGKTTLISKTGILDAINNLGEPTIKHHSTLTQQLQPIKVYNRITNPHEPERRIGASTALGAYNIINSKFGVHAPYKRDGSANVKSKSAFVSEQAKMYSSPHKYNNTNGKKNLQDIAFRDINKNLLMYPNELIRHQDNSEINCNCIT